MMIQKIKSSSYSKTLKLALATLSVLLILLGATACSSSKNTNTPETIRRAATEQPAEMQTQQIDDNARPQESSEAQMSDEEKYHDVVFSGGGAKGIALIGSIRALEEAGVSYNRLVGTSAGTILAVLVAAGYTADELEESMLERTDDGAIIMASFLEIPESFDDEAIRESITYDTFQDLVPSFVSDEITDKISYSLTKTLLRIPQYRQLFSFVEYGGVFSGDKAAEWLAEQLDADGRNLSGTTLAEFHQRTGSDFTAVATDATLGEMLILNHRTAPDLPVVEATRMSTAVPFVYQEVEWQPEWGAYMGSDISGNNIVDGGLSSNLAIELVLSLEPEILDAMGGAPNRDRVIGLFLDEHMSWDGFSIDEEKNDTSGRNPLVRHWLGAKDRFMHIIDTMLRSHDHFIANSHPSNVCHIPVKGYATMDFHLSEKQMDALVDAGEAAMAACLEERQEAPRIRE